MSANTNTVLTADFIRSWIETQKKDANSEVLELIVSHLSGANLDQLDEKNLLKSLIELADKEVENDNN